MADKGSDSRIFVGGLSWETTERQLEDAFGRFGKVLESQIMLDRDTGRPRGFGFVTFADRRAMQDAIAEFHGMELNGRTISVNRAQPRASDDGYGYGGFSSGGRGGHISDDGSIGKSDCFKCGRPGHWARDCPSTGDGGRVGGRFPPPPRYPGGRGDRARGSYNDRYADDRYDGGRYGERDRVVSRDSRYGGRDRYGGDRSPAGRDRVGSDRYGSPAGRDRVGSDRYGSSDRYPQNGHVKERGGYDRDGGRGSDRYGSGGPTRYEGGSDRYGSGGPTRYEGGSYRDRAAPYDRPSKGRPSSHDDRY